MIVVTSINSHYWNEQFRINLKSWINFFPKDFKIIVYVEDEIPDKPDYKNVKWRNLYKSCPELLEFIDRHKDNEHYNGRSNTYFKLNAIKFAHKTFPLWHAAKVQGEGKLIWLDADVLAIGKIDDNFVNNICPSDKAISYLGRTTTFSECGFVYYNLDNQIAKEFLDKFENYYKNNNLDQLKETHDSAVFDVVRESYDQIHFLNLNRNAVDDKHPVNRSELNPYFTHQKGDEKLRKQNKFIKKYNLSEILLEEHLGGHNNKTHLDEGALKWIINDLGAQSFLDIGCGPGGMVELADKLGLKSLGVDGDYTLERYNEKKFVIHDYTTGPLILNQKFDIAWSVEFLEHVYEEYIENYMRTFQCAKNVIVTHALPGTIGHHHVNLQKEDYWIEKFTNYGFKFNQNLTNQLRENSTMNYPKKKRKAFVKNTGLFFTNEN